MHRLRPEQRGAAVVEFALVLPLLMSSLAMVLATGLRMFYVGVAENEVRRVARTAGIRTTSSQSSPYPDNTAANRLALCGKGALPVPGATFNASTDCLIVKDPNVSSPNEGDLVTVTLTYRVTAIQGLLGWVPGGIVDGLSVIRVSASVYRE
jgi:Flp pilus assembly protein TadG